MAVSDRSRASLPEDAGEPDGSAGAERPRKEDGAAGAGPGVGAEESAPAPERSPEPTRRRSSKKAAEDTESLLRRLEQAGFSRAEASRLIFERMRPREEGLVRS